MIEHPTNALDTNAPRELSAHEPSLQNPRVVRGLLRVENDAYLPTSTMFPDDRPIGLIWGTDSDGLHFYPAFGTLSIDPETVLGFEANSLFQELDTAYLAPLKGLRCLILADAPVTDASLKLMLPLPALLDINLIGTNVANHALEYLAVCDGLTDIRLDRTEITDIGLRHIHQFHDLYALSLSDTRITDVGIHEFRHLGNLMHVDLAGTCVTASETAELRHYLPDTDIWEHRPTTPAPPKQHDWSELGESYIITLGFPAHRSIGRFSELDDGGYWIEPCEARGIIDCQCHGPLAFQASPGFVSAGDIREIPLLDAFMEVDFSWVTLTDHELSNLSIDPAVLNLSDTSITDISTLRLRHLENLESLNLSGTGITDITLTYLHMFKQLRFLDLSNTEVTDEGLRWLEFVPNLWSINLSGTNVGDKGLTALGSLPNLMSLDVTGTGVTDNGFVTPESFPELMFLCVTDTAVTDEGIETLVESLPSLVDLWD